LDFSQLRFGPIRFLFRRRRLGLRVCKLGLTRFEFFVAGGSSSGCEVTLRVDGGDL
jgi:hypothetical protein